MTVAGRDKIHEFINKHREAEKPLRSWLKILETSSYEHFVDLKKTFPRADYLKPYTVFDIGGNKYRVATLISYETKVTLIKAVMTHGEYGRGQWKKRR